MLFALLAHEFIMNKPSDVKALIVGVAHAVGEDIPGNSLGDDSDEMTAPTSDPRPLMLAVKTFVSNNGARCGIAVPICVFFDFQSRPQKVQAAAGRQCYP